MDALTDTLAAAFVAVAAIFNPGTSKSAADLPRLPRIRGRRGDHRDAVSDDMRGMIEADAMRLLY